MPLSAKPTRSIISWFSTGSAGGVANQRGERTPTLRRDVELLAHAVRTGRHPLHAHEPGRGQPLRLRVEVRLAERPRPPHRAGVLAGDAVGAHRARGQEAEQGVRRGAEPAGHARDATPQLSNELLYSGVMGIDRSTVAFVTGAGRGIGAAIADRLRAEGATVVTSDLAGVTSPST